MTVGAGKRRYCYDANGNLTSQSLASGGGTIRYDTSTWCVANLAKCNSLGTSATSELWYGTVPVGSRAFGFDQSPPWDPTAAAPDPGYPFD